MASNLPPISKSMSMDGFASQSGKSVKFTSKRPQREHSIDLSDNNPFVLPRDENIFSIRSQQRLLEQRKKQEAAETKVWERKGDEPASRIERIRLLLGEEAATFNGDTHNDKMPVKVYHGTEKESTSDFIAKKKEMFLVRMVIDTKSEEIRKLEEKAAMKEDALLKSEEMLEEDSLRFDAFLKENDKKAHDSIKRAEEETKKKMEKNQEIKKLNYQIQALSSEINKQKELLDDCLRYKQFLDSITPAEHFETHRKIHEEAVEAARHSQHEKKYKEWEHLRKRLHDQHRREMEHLRKEKSRDKDIEKQISSLDSKYAVPPPPKLEEEVVSISYDDPPMYFTDPKQLMDVFSALEEQNLFLIQNSQETEFTLEELQNSYKKLKSRMNKQSNQLQVQLEGLRSAINVEKQRTTVLQEKRSGDSEATREINYTEKENLLTELNKQVRLVYEACGFSASSKPSTIFMLSQLESKLEFLLDETEKIPAEYLLRAEKSKEKARRERKREESQALQIKQQEERNRRANERSMQAPKKRNGRQVMFRSKPIWKETEKQDSAILDHSNSDEIKYLT